MRASLTVSLLLAIVGAKAPGSEAARVKSGSCTDVVLDGELRAGQQFRHVALSGLEARLDPLPSGWVLRIGPASGVRREEDFAEMATPPYRSVNPLLVSTDFSFRAQDAIGWNPRRFHFAADQQSFDELQLLRRASEAGGSAGRHAAAELARVASEQPEGTLEILDAHLVPGIADQTRGASMVAGHFLTTAHALEQPAGGRASALGEVTWIRFRIKLSVPRGAHPASGVLAQPAVCGGR